MYVRFKTSFVDEYHDNRFGVFQAASYLLRSDIMCPYEQQWLEGIWHWFRYNLSAPSPYKKNRVDSNIICWFKPTAKEHLQKMFEMAMILEQYGLCVYQVKTRRPGYIVYEDDEQVAVLPFAESRRKVR